jgi:hypothetical protein
MNALTVDVLLSARLKMGFVTTTVTVIDASRIVTREHIATTTITGTAITIIHRTEQ